MVSYIATFTLIAVMATVSNSLLHATPQICEPGILEEMPQHIKTVCYALQSSNPLSNALDAYIQNEAAALLYKTEDLLKRHNGKRDVDEKRTDIDHIFLRFGRKR